MTQTATLVLVADDDPEILRIVRRLLESKGMSVLSAADGDEAMAQVLEQQPDLVILDVMMPGQTGWEVCRGIREIDDLEATRIIMLTGIGERLNEMTSPLYGADAHLNKPFELEELDALIDKVLSDRENSA